MGTASKLDDLVQSVSLYKKSNFLLHLYTLPFVVGYVCWVYVWCTIFGFWEHYEGGLIGLAAIGCLQILCSLACYWSVHIHCFCTCKKEGNIQNATLVKVIPTANNGSPEIVRLRHVDDKQQTAYFLFQKTKYIWQPNKKMFSGLQYPIHNSYSEYTKWKGYQEDNEIRKCEQLYGRNELEMVVPEFLELFKERATAPFFVFQVFCVVLWCMDRYWYYSVFTLIMLVLFECTLVQQQLRNMAEIRKMGNKPYNLPVYRNRKWRSILSNELIPGDIISVTRPQKDSLVPCDVVLLRGSCIVDESLLTGESVPQMKEAIENFNGAKELDPDGDGKLHVLFGGTKVVQHTPPSKTGTGIRPNDNGCLAYVLRTSFSTSQGKLLRTILFGVKRVTANNKETFGFIMFLLVFAVAAAGYVWQKGCEDPDRNRYKLFLECTLILTSVIPPELPIELSLAVNASLLALSRLGVFCTEPFRIPFAGKVDICCFDKTGTLTSDNLVVEGVAMAERDSTVTLISEAPKEALQTLATCHSLVQIDDGLVGDPLEKATLTAVDFTLSKSDTVIPKRGKLPALRILQRFHFSSGLRRMSVIASYMTPGSTEINYVATVKGAPEVLKKMFNVTPVLYDDVYLELSRRGARVLALGFKNLGKLSSQRVKDLTRDEVESGLQFAGFVIISCPLKTDSKAVIRELQHASHHIVMITGDNALTACHVAKELKITRKPLLVLSNYNHQWQWETIDKNVTMPLFQKDVTALSGYNLCLTGDGLDYVKRESVQFLRRLLPRVSVFARFAPKQKEFVIVQLKSQGYVTLMCGDGTNDVGALKHADVGVAILANAPEKLPSEMADAKRLTKKSELLTSTVASNNTNSFSGKNRHLNHSNRNHLESKEKIQANVNKLINELEEFESQQVVKLGDASIASPFTSKLSSITCICHIIKQGRCTLVTTLQMFKILALNALILAYTQSVLYLDGIKLSDVQATLQGLLLAACFLFISRSKPLRTLSTQRPLPTIFNVYTILTVLLQFTVHFASLVFLVQQAKLHTPLTETVANETTTSIIVNQTVTETNFIGDAINSTSSEVDSSTDSEEFEANIVNSTVYIISMALQIATFAINYRGNPYMESLRQNKALLYSILASGGTVLALSMGIVPILAEKFEIIDFPADFRIVLVSVLFADFFFAFLVDRCCLWLCGEGQMKSL